MMLVFGGFAVFFAWAIGSSVYESVRIRRAWSEVADAFGLEYSGGIFGAHRLEGDYRGVQVDVSVREEGFTKEHEEYFTDYEVALPEAADSFYEQEELAGLQRTLEGPGSAFEIRDGAVRITQKGIVSRADMHRINLEQLVDFRLEVEEALESSGSPAPDPTSDADEQHRREADRQSDTVFEYDEADAEW